MEERRLMAVHAHPDDESSKGAGMSAKYAKRGRVRVVTCTGGERGDVLNPNLLDDLTIAERITEIRQSEMAEAAAALGVEHHWLGFEDSGLPEGDPLPPLPGGCFATIPLDEPVARLVKEIREFRPQVLTTYDENGGYPHPDHIRTHEVSMAALDAAADPSYRPDLGEPWTVAKVYYDISFSNDRLKAFHDGITAAGGESPFGDWLARRDGRKGHEATTRIEVSAYFPQRDAALRAQATQIDPDGFFFAMPRDLEAEIWPWEEFTLVRSTVGFPEGIEFDLFERIPDVELLA